MKRTAWAVAILGLVAGCGEKKQSRSDDGEKTADKDEGGCRLAGAAAPADMVSGKQPQVIAPLAAIKLGMSPKEARAACPNLFKGETATKAGTFSASDIIGKAGTDYLHARLNFTADKLTSVEVEAPAAIAEPLAAAWGAPQKSADAKLLAWFDEATHTRAILGAEQRGVRELAISSYRPIKDFLELDTKSIAFKPNDVLGKTPGELLKQFPQYAGKDMNSAANQAAADEMMKELRAQAAAKGVQIKEHEDDVEVRLPATPYAGETTTHVILHRNDDGTVRQYGVWLRGAGASWPQQRAEVIKQMDALWGPHKIVKETLGERMTWYEPKTGVRASASIKTDTPGEIDLDYVRYLPLATLFGAPGSLWGFEGETPLIGRTRDEVAAAFGKAYKPDDDTATIKLPPTDYESDSGATTILIFFERDKVKEWNLSLPFEDYGPARSEYEAALDAKLGKGKPGKRETVTYKGVSARYSEITHHLDLEVTK